MNENYISIDEYAQRDRDEYLELQNSQIDSGFEERLTLVQEQDYE